MYIRSDESGKINLFGNINIVGCEEYNGDIPSDFNETVGDGKYLFINGEIVISPDWIDKIKVPTITQEFEEGTVEVIGVPVNYKQNYVLLQVNVIYAGGQTLYKEFLADNTTIMPDGRGQFEALYDAIEQGGSSFNELVRLNIIDLYNQGRIF